MNPQSSCTRSLLVYPPEYPKERSLTPMVSSRKYMLFLLFLLPFACTERLWLGPLEPSNTCNPGDVPSIRNSLTWRETWGSASGLAKGCLVIHWGAKDTERKSSLVSVKKDGQLLGADGTSTTLEMAFPVDTKGASRDFRLFIFGFAMQPKSSEELGKLCDGAMRAADYKCLERAGSECWLYMDFYPRPGEGVKANSPEKSGKCFLYSRKRSGSEMSQEHSEEPGGNEASFEPPKPEPAMPDEPSIEPIVEKNPEPSVEPVVEDAGAVEVPPEKDPTEEGPQPPPNLCNVPKCVSTLSGNSERNFVGPKLSVWFNFPKYASFDVAGNMYVSDSQVDLIKKIDALTDTVSIFAGTGRRGSANGLKNKAQFWIPYGTLFDNGGDMIVADSFNHRLRKIDMGTGVVSNYAGSGTQGNKNGPAASAQLDYPQKLLKDAQGNIYILQRNSNTMRILDTNGVIGTYAGKLIKGYADGDRLVAQFDRPDDFAMDTAGNIYVADTYNHRIRRIDAKSGKVSTVAGNGSTGYKDGTGTQVQFNYPRGIAVDSKGIVFVADTNNSRIRQIDTSGKVTTFLGTGRRTVVVGPRTGASIVNPERIIVDKNDDLYIFLGSNHPFILKVDRKKDLVSIFAGTLKAGFADGPANVAKFNYPGAIVADAKGLLYVVDNNNHRIRKVELNGNVSTVAGDGTRGCIDGPVKKARFSYPKDLALTKTGDILVVDGLCHSIRKIDMKNGMVSTIAGGKGASGNIDAPGSSARFSFPEGIAIDSRGYIYIADARNHKIREISPSGQVTTFAGTGQRGKNNGAKGQATFAEPTALAFDAQGDLLVVDKYNYMIRKISKGVVSTLSGSGSNGRTNGPGNRSSFNNPSKIAIAKNGTIYVADLGNHMLRTVSTTGVTATLLGGTQGHFDGVGHFAMMNGPSGITIGPKGFLYVTEVSGNRIRRVKP